MSALEDWIVAARLSLIPVSARAVELVTRSLDPPFGHSGPMADKPQLSAAAPFEWIVLASNPWPIAAAAREAGIERTHVAFAEDDDLPDDVVEVVNCEALRPFPDSLLAGFRADGRKVRGPRGIDMPRDLFRTVA